MGYRNLLRLTVSSVSAEAVVVEGDGLRLVATPVGTLTVGQPVVVGIRPDDLVVTEGAPGSADHGSVSTPDDTNRIEAQVEVVEYQGRDFAMDARTAGGLRLHVRTQHRLTPGAALALTVTVDHVRAFSDDRDGEAAGGAPGQVVAGEPAAPAMAGQAAT
jgi:putative spermidine/putrescine transport system ATP-binding protein